MIMENMEILKKRVLQTKYTYVTLDLKISHMIYTSSVS